MPSPTLFDVRRPSFTLWYAVAALLLCTAGVLSSPAAHAQQNTTPQADLINFDIPAQDLSDALSDYARQSGQDLLYKPEQASGRAAGAVEGSMTRTEAMRQLLAGTGLQFEFHETGSMLIGDEATLEAYRRQLNSGAAIAGQNTVGQRRPGIEEIIVTGQKREERIQDVPIAISAFSPEDLEAQKIEGGFDLLKGVPNVTFSKTNFTGYNFQIRGIGTQAVSATTDPGVAVSFNNTTLIVNRLFEQEYLDVERVEVLRGPQGTLFGRNATGGVINVISNKPEMGVWDGMIDVEVGNYNTRRLRGFFNAPIGDTLAIRGAYASTKRDGFGYNEASETNDTRTFGDQVSRDVDDRDLWTGRFSVAWQPTDRLRANFIWERFEEDDNRVRTSKQLCHRDDSPDGVNGVSFDEDVSPYQRATLSQGCQPGSLYSDGAFGTVNGTSLPYVSGPYFAQQAATFYAPQARSFVLGPHPYGVASEGGEPVANAPCELAANNAGSSDRGRTFSFNPCNPDPYVSATQSRDLRTIYSEIQPQYHAESDIFELSLDFELTDELLLTSQTVYATDEYYATQDYNRFASQPFWSDGSTACGASFVPLFAGLPQFGGNVVKDCSDDPDDGRGTFLALTDADGIRPAPPTLDVDYASVDGDGFLRDADGHRIGYYAALFNDGVFCDPQLGCSDKLVAQDLSQSESTQYNQEFRLVSSFAGDVNFSLGANYTRFETQNDYYVFSNSFTSLLHFFPFNYPDGGDLGGGSSCPLGQTDGRFCRYIDPSSLDEIIAGQGGDGHNYFRSANPYRLDSAGLFGELYWNVTDTVKMTFGGRVTWDRKVFTPIPSQLLLADYRDLSIVGPGDAPPDAQTCADISASGGIDCPFTGTAPDGRGAPAQPDIVQEWIEPTGRVVVDWQPVLDFTDETLVYASFSHGYKGGGANPPAVAPPAGNITARSSGGAAPPTFEPEFVNAYEVGTKNTLLNGALTLNLTGFYYDYTDYQVSKIVDRRAVNENFDAELWGLELESIFAPTLDWQFNAAIGFLQTEIAQGEGSIDLMDRTLGGNASFTTPDGITYESYTVVKPWVSGTSNCVVPTELVMGRIEDEVSDSPIGENIYKMCPTGSVLGGGGSSDSTDRRVPYFERDENGEWVYVPTTLGGTSTAPNPDHDGRTYVPFVDAPNNSAGFEKDLSGNELPNAPQFTVSLGGQYSFDLARDWRATARMDYYWQDESYARVYNFEPYDRLKSWSNTNLSFWVNNPVNGITVEAYVKNVFDETPITGSFLNSDDSGLTTNVFTLDPRLIGVSLRKEF